MFKNLFNKIIEGRQDRVNAEVARMLQREYPNETQQYIQEHILGNK